MDARECIPAILYEDEHLLAVNKPAGWNTHAPSPYASEGLYDWLRHREPRWANLAIIHRLDKETSGVILFGKSTQANRSLTEQFAGRAVRKEYVLLTDRAPTAPAPHLVSGIARAGEKYVTRPLVAGAERAETHFEVRRRDDAGRVWVTARPVTGRTHQIRVHASALGFPILGDTLYGGTPAARVFLHAESLTFRHPVTGEERTLSAPAEFTTPPNLALRRAWRDPALTDAFRVVHGAVDGWPGWYVDRLGPHWLSQSEQPLTPDQQRYVREILLPSDIPGTAATTASVYHKVLHRQVRKTNVAEASPQLVQGAAVPGEFVARENGVQYSFSFEQGYSVGLFLDQRDNRRCFLRNHVAAEFPVFSEGPAKAEVLNTFAYTCGFSVCAALAGARATSLDVSRKYLEWGKRNFTLNGLDPAAHDFVYGDTFDWLRRWRKKGRFFDVIILDPPTFSRTKEHGEFRAQKDYRELVEFALPILKPNGLLLASTNAAGWAPEEFVQTITAAIVSAGRRVARQHYVPPPPDFPITRAEPGQFKSVWLRIS